MLGKIPKVYIVSTIIIVICAVFLAKIWYFSTTDSNGIPAHFISYEFAHSRPEGRLYYPSAHVLSLNGMGQHMTETGWGGAWSGAILTSNDSPNQIYQWYDKWLITHGWQKDSKAIAGLASTQTSLQSYTKDGKGMKSKETFYVAMNDPKQLGWTIGKKLPNNTIVFEISYYIKPSK